MDSHLTLRERRKIHLDKPDNCLRCGLYQDCKSYKIPLRQFYTPGFIYSQYNTEIVPDTVRGDIKVALLVAMNPGIEEDRENEILIGKSGKLLMEYVEEYLSDHIVYVTNAVKCYIPPENFNKKGEIPLANIRYCNDFLKQDIESIKPDIIVGLGKIACQALDLLGVEYIKSHHPSYILHGGSDALTKDVMIRVDATLRDDLVKIPYGGYKFPALGAVGLDFEWDWETGKIHTVALASENACWSSGWDELSKNIVRNLLSNPEVTIVGHDLARAEVLKCLEIGITEINCKFMDTIILLRELIDDRSEQALKDFAYRHLLIEDYTKHIPRGVEYRDYMKSYNPDVARICAADAWTSLYIWKCLKEDFKEEYDGMELARQADMDMILPTAVMMHKGIGLDMSKVEEHRVKLVDLVPTMELEFYRDYDTPVSSPAAILSWIHSFPHLRKVKDTNKESLQKILDMEQDVDIVRFVERVLDYRQKSKLVSTYLKPLPNLMDKNGVIHSYIQIAGANNGRPTSSSPNIANIPRRTYNMKDIFCSKFGKSGRLGTLDASESEFRHFAYLSQDQWLIENYKQGIGMHDSISREVGISRDNTKTLNFARLYGAKVPKLKSVLLDAGLKGKDLESKLNRYLEATKSFQKYQDKTIKTAYERGYILSPDGRRGYRLSPNEIANYPVSAFSSYSNKKRLRWLFDRMKSENLVSHIWLDLYDSIELDIYRGEEKKIREILKEMDQEVPDILNYGIHLPLNVELKICGHNWS